MPKQDVNERFLISCEASQEQVGGIIAHLTRLGLTNIKFDLIADVRSFSRNAPPKDGISNTDYLRAWIVEHPTFKAIEAQNYFRNDNRPAVYPTLRALVDEGLLKKMGPGDYSRADVKHIAGPKKAKAASPAKAAAKAKVKKKQPSFEINAEEALLRIARRNHGRFTSELAKKHFEVLGRATSSVGPTIRDLMNKNLIKRGSTGSYSLTAKAMTGPKGVRKTKANGAMPAVVEPVADAAVTAEA